MSKKDNKVCSRGDDTGCGRSRIGLWRIFWGLFFIAAATAVIFNILNIYTFAGLNVGWIILGIFLIALTINCLFKLNWFGVFIPLAGLATIANYQTEYLNVTDQTIGAIWIVAGLLAIGFSILFHRSWHKYVHVGGFKNDFSDKYEKVIDQEDDSEIFVKVHMGSTIKHVNTDDFKRAVLKANLGAIKVYFDNAKIKGDKAEIIVDGSLSGFELYIPREWRVVNNVKCSLAGVEEKYHRASDSKATKTVVLSGKIDLAGIEITYV